MTHLEKLTKALPEGRALLVSSEINQRWLTGFEYTDGYVLVCPENAYLLTDFRYIEAARAEADKGFEVMMPEGTMLVAEMLGLPVYHEQSGEQLGVLKDIIHPGASDIYVIDTPKGDAMVPVVAEFVKRVDEQGIYLLPIEGMFAQ